MNVQNLQCPYYIAYWYPQLIIPFAQLCVHFPQICVPTVVFYSAADRYRHTRSAHLTNMDEERLHQFFNCVYQTSPNQKACAAQTNQKTCAAAAFNFSEKCNIVTQTCEEPLTKCGAFCKVGQSVRYEIVFPKKTGKSYNVRNLQTSKSPPKAAEKETITSVKNVDGEPKVQKSKEKCAAVRDKNRSCLNNIFKNLHFDDSNCEFSYGTTESESKSLESGRSQHSISHSKNSLLQLYIEENRKLRMHLSQAYSKNCLKCRNTENFLKFYKIENDILKQKLEKADATVKDLENVIKKGASKNKEINNAGMQTSCSHVIKLNKSPSCSIETTDHIYIPYKKGHCQVTDSKTVHFSNRNKENSNINLQWCEDCGVHEKFLYKEAPNPINARKSSSLSSHTSTYSYQNLDYRSKNAQKISSVYRESISISPTLSCDYEQDKTQKKIPLKDKEGEKHMNNSHSKQKCKYINARKPDHSSIQEYENSNIHPRSKPDSEYIRVEESNYVKCKNECEPIKTCPSLKSCIKEYKYNNLRPCSESVCQRDRSHKSCSACESANRFLCSAFGKDNGRPKNDCNYTKKIQYVDQCVNSEYKVERVDDKKSNLHQKDKCQANNPRPYIKCNLGCYNTDSINISADAKYNCQAIHSEKNKSTCHKKKSVHTNMYLNLKSDGRHIAVLKNNHGVNVNKFSNSTSEKVQKHKHIFKKDEDEYFNTELSKNDIKNPEGSLSTSKKHNKYPKNCRYVKPYLEKKPTHVRPFSESDCKRFEPKKNYLKEQCDGEPIERIPMCCKSTHMKLRPCSQGSNERSKSQKNNLKESCHKEVRFHNVPCSQETYINIRQSSELDYRSSGTREKISKKHCNKEECEPAGSCFRLKSGCELIQNLKNNCVGIEEKCSHNNISFCSKDNSKLPGFHSFAKENECQKTQKNNPKNYETANIQLDVTSPELKSEINGNPENVHLYLTEKIECMNISSSKNDNENISNNIFIKSDCQSINIQETSEAYQQENNWLANVCTKDHKCVSLKKTSSPFHKNEDECTDNLLCSKESCEAIDIHPHPVKIHSASCQRFEIVNVSTHTYINSYNNLNSNRKNNDEFDKDCNSPNVKKDSMNMSTDPNTDSIVLAKNNVIMDRESDTTWDSVFLSDTDILENDSQFHLVDEITMTSSQSFIVTTSLKNNNKGNVAYPKTDFSVYVYKDSTPSL